MATHLRQDLVEATLPEEDGGSGRAEEFWVFCEEKTRNYTWSAEFDEKAIRKADRRPVQRGLTG